MIDVKASQWLNDSKMSNFLRPETLFGSKFEGYLNEKVVGGNKTAMEMHAPKGVDESYYLKED